MHSHRWIQSTSRSHLAISKNGSRISFYIRSWLQRSVDGQHLAPLPHSNDILLQNQVSPPFIPLYFKPMSVGHSKLSLSSPHSIKYCTQEIVVFRKDLSSKLRRSCIMKPSGDEPDLHKHVACTIHPPLTSRLFQLYLINLTLFLFPCQYKRFIGDMNTR